MSLRVLPRTGLLALASLCLALFACGSSDDPAAALEAGRSALQGDDYESALPEFEAVVASSTATEGQKYAAQRDMVICAAQVHGAEQAAEAFQALADTYASRLDVDTLSKVGRDLAKAGCSDVAIEVVALATEKYAKNEQDKQELGKLANVIASLGTTDANLERLKALGYLGE